MLTEKKIKVVLGSPIDKVGRRRIVTRPTIIDKGFGVSLNTENFQKSTAYLDGALMSLAGDKVVIISYGTKQDRFYISSGGEVNRCAENGPAQASQSDFELYRMTFLEALMDGGSLIVRQLAVGELPLPEALGGGSVPLDYLSAASVGAKGIRGLKAEELKKMYPNGADGAVEYRDFPSKEQVRLAMLQIIDAEQEG
jgi:hypothetical protein